MGNGVWIRGTEPELFLRTDNARSYFVRPTKRARRLLFRTSSVVVPRIPNYSRGNISGKGLTRRRVRPDICCTETKENARTSAS